MSQSESYTIDETGFARLFSALQQRGYTVVGPCLRDGAIVYDELSALSDLPIGWSDEQAPGSYRLHERQDKAYFAYNVGPQSFKQYLFPARRKLWSASRVEDRFTVTPEPLEGKKLAFLGVRACELAAMGIQDRVFLEGSHIDPFYKNQREKSITIAVNCTQAASTCFCTSMDGSPQHSSGYDLVLTELLDEKRHVFVLQGGSQEGNDLLRDLDPALSTDAELALQKEAIAHATKQMQTHKGMDTSEIKELLYRNVDSGHWDDVAKRCLSCGNCTLACPTCFCSDVQDVTDLSGDHTERWKSWDSCFSLDHSYVHGGAIRQSTQSRYRQWLTHKLGSWIDQFGSSGCVGCGRCVTWCPVSIDIRDEVAALRKSENGEPTL